MPETYWNSVCGMEAALLSGSNILRPDKLVGVDLQQKKDNQYFKRYKSSRSAENNIKTYWGTDQGNSTLTPSDSSHGVPRFSWI